VGSLKVFLFFWKQLGLGLIACTKTVISAMWLVLYICVKTLTLPYSFATSKLTDYFGAKRVYRQIVQSVNDDTRSTVTGRLSTQTFESTQNKNNSHIDK